jgi:hypothetical protein
MDGSAGRKVQTASSELGCDGDEQGRKKKQEGSSQQTRGASQSREEQRMKRTRSGDREDAKQTDDEK